LTATTSTKPKKSGEDDFELDEYLQNYLEDDPSAYKLRSNNYSRDEEDKQAPIAVQRSFHDYLEQQLGLLNFANDEEAQIAAQIIGSIDEDGYLRREPTALLDDLMFSQNIFTDEATIRKLIARIQRLDPPGVAASDLQECLLLQLDLKLEEPDKLDDERLENIKLARLLLRRHFDAFTKKHYEKLQKQLDISAATLKAAIEEVVKLNPKPASGYSTNSNRNAQYITPDFFIYNRDGELQLELNARNAPDLRISDQYKEMLQAYRANARHGKSQREQKEAVVFIKQKIDSAKWFIDAIRQRQGNHVQYHVHHSPVSIRLLYDWRPQADEAHDPERYCRYHRAGHQHDLPGGQQQVCTDRIWYLPPQRVLL
jgi:RNA polymerase sigma-54 factor